MIIELISLEKPAVPSEDLSYSITQPAKRAVPLSRPNQRVSEGPSRLKWRLNSMWVIFFWNFLKFPVVALFFKIVLIQPLHCASVGIPDVAVYSTFRCHQEEIVPPFFGFPTHFYGPCFVSARPKLFRSYFAPSLDHFSTPQNFASGVLRRGPFLEK